MMLQNMLKLRSGGRSALLLCLSVLVVAACGLGMDTQARLDRGHQAFSEGEYRAAVIDAKNILLEEPDNVAARLLLGRASVEIGDGTVIREFVTIHRSAKESQTTKIGKHCMLMNYVHIAHDCEIGDHVVIVNYTGLSGHVVVGDRAFVSGQVGVHQFVRIGKNAMVGGKTAITKDILPYSLVEGVPARLISINAIGLRRNHIQPKVRTALKNAFKILQDPANNTTQAIEKMETEIEKQDEIRYLIHFIKLSSRGITK